MRYTIPRGSAHSSLSLEVGVAATPIPHSNPISPYTTVLHTRYRALGPELIPVYRQSACRWLEAIHPAVGCYYFPPGLRLLSQPKSVTAHRPVPNYTAWWQRQVRVSSLFKAVTWKLTGRDSNPRPFRLLANALPVNHTGHYRNSLSNVTIDGSIRYMSCNWSIARDDRSWTWPVNWRGHEQT